MSDKRLFGTDGIRGEAGAFPLDPDTVWRVGMALATVLATSGGKPRVLIGRDPRQSGGDIELSLAQGLVAGGARVSSGGILTTPAVAFLTRDGGFDAGVVISASHNPFRDNGIKIFSRDGYKLPDPTEKMVETLVLDDDEPDGAGAPPPRVEIYPHGADPLLKTRYQSYLMASLGPGFSFDGQALVLDCANGAASAIAPEVFRRLGATVHVLHAEPNGRNINLDCGALHPEALAAEVLRRAALLGIAYDGDADRCILVDEQGSRRDGDDILAVAAAEMRAEGRLDDGGVVLTVMANLGLEKYLGSLGLDLVRAQVGDKYVLDEMRRRGAVLGGEQSGHVIFLDHATTGDGILTSLLLAATVVRSGRPLSKLAACWTRLPQVLRNVKVRERVDLSTLPKVAAALGEVETSMRDRGRLLVRYSGTEPLLRIMLEGPDQAEIDGHAARLAGVVAEVIG